MINNLKNKQGGFLQLILLLIIAIALLSYLDISIRDMVDWFKSNF